MGSSKSLQRPMFRHRAVNSSCGVFSILPCPPADASVETSGGRRHRPAPTPRHRSGRAALGFLGARSAEPVSSEREGEVLARRRNPPAAVERLGHGLSPAPPAPCRGSPAPRRHRWGEPLRSPLHTPGCTLLSPHFPEFKQKTLPTHPGRPRGAEPGAAGRRGAGTGSGPSPSRPEPPPPPRPPHCTAPPLLPPPAPPGLTYSPTRIYSPSVCCEK